MARKPRKKREDNPKKKGGGPKQPFAVLPETLDIKKVGRPSKYDPSYCDLVIELGNEGKSLAQMARCIGVHPETLTNWTKEHPEFFEAIKIARAWAQAWWEDLGQINCTRMGFNATSFIFQMKNRFPDQYKDRHEHSGQDGGPILHSITRRIVDPAKPKGAAARAARA